MNEKRRPEWRSPFVVSECIVLFYQSFLLFPVELMYISKLLFKELSDVSISLIVELNLGFGVPSLLKY
jgi:hypothetical protein